MMLMRAVPKPKITKNTVASPKLTEEDFMEIGEKIAEALEFNSEVVITVFAQKRYETVVGKITSADAQTGYLKLKIGMDSVRININNIVKVG